MSDEQLEKLYESMSDDDLASFWNHSGITDDMGELEEELMSRGFEDSCCTSRTDRWPRADHLHREGVGFGTVRQSAV